MIFPKIDTAYTPKNYSINLCYYLLLVTKIALKIQKLYVTYDKISIKFKLSLFKVNGGSAAERAGLQAGDALIRVNNTDVYTLRHQEAQDTIRAAGPALELTVQR